MEHLDLTCAQNASLCPVLVLGGSMLRTAMAREKVEAASRLEF